MGVRTRVSARVLVDPDGVLVMSARVLVRVLVKDTKKKAHRVNGVLFSILI